VIAAHRHEWDDKCIGQKGQIVRLEITAAERRRRSLEQPLGGGRLLQDRVSQPYAMSP
jgi:hypothetical protein